MSSIVQVKGLRLGEGRPKICVSLVGKTNKQIIEEAKYLKKLKLDLVEWRADHYEFVKDLNRVKELLKQLREEIKDLPILFTFRSKKEGGEKEISIKYYIELNKVVVDTKKIDLIDIELFMGDDIVKDIVTYAHNNNIKVVISNHDFDKTPEQKEIITRLCKMQDLGADLPKIAVMPKSTKDVLTLLCATNEMITEHAKRPIITMSMGDIGLVSRISGETFGSALTFGAAKKASAPGQIAVQDLYEVLNLIHRNR